MSALSVYAEWRELGERGGEGSAALVSGLKDLSGFQGWRWRHRDGVWCVCVILSSVLSYPNPTTLTLMLYS